MTTLTLARVADLRIELSGEDRERLEFLGLLGGAVALPLLLGFSQPLVGTLVNALLVVTALHVRSWARLAPMIVLPSVVAVGGGWVLGGGDHAPWAALPVFWAGNAALVVGLKALHLARGAGFAPSLAAVAALKTLVIGAGLVALAAAGVLAAPALAALVGLQLVTALAGGALGYGASRAYGHLIAR